MFGWSCGIIRIKRQETQMIKVIVIGAGVMGASTAYRLAQAGAAVTVLEATRIGGGTSGISFAWTNANKKPPKAYHDLNVAGMKAHAALADEFGATPWWHGGGSLEWEGEPDRTAQRRALAQVRFAQDSPLEGDGFELPVPREKKSRNLGIPLEFN